MSSFRLAQITAIVLLTLATVTGLSIWLTRLRRRRQLAHDATLIEPLRPALIQIAADDDDDGSARRALAEVDPRTWKAILPRIVGLGRQLTGASAESMQRLLQVRGADRQAIRQTQRHSPAQRLRGAELLGLCPSEVGFDALTTLLGDGDSAVRIQAARSLARVGDPAAVGPLLAALDGDRALPKIEVGFALIRLGGPAIPALADAVAHHPSITARTMAAEVLGRIGDTRALSALLLAVRNPDHGDDLRAAAARAIGYIGDPDAEPFLVGLATDEDAGRTARCAAIAALAAVDARDSAPLLGDLLSSDDLRIGSAAGEALVGLGPEGQAILDAAVLGDGTARRQAAAAISLRALHPAGRR